MPATTTPDHVILGSTSLRVFELIEASDTPVSARVAMKETGIDIGQARSILRTLRTKHSLIEVAENDDEKDRTIYYTVASDAIARVEQGKAIAAERAEKRAASPTKAEPMDPELFAPGFLAVARYDMLITRYTGMLYRDRKDGFEQGKTRTFTLEGDEWTGTTSELVADLRRRRAAIASLPEFVARLRLELNEVIEQTDEADETEVEPAVEAA